MGAIASDHHDAHGTASADACVERARAVAPIIEAAAARIEAARELPRDVLSALHEARLFRLLLPRSLDGAELDLASLVRVMEIVAKADASTAWCLGQAAGCAMAAAYLPPRSARTIFGGRDAVLAWGAGAQGQAVAAEDGYRVTGTWMFASGSRHATWLGGHCKVYEADGRPRLRPDGQPAERTALFPREQATIRDLWHVVGLRGTGSDEYSVADLFVPADETIGRDEAAERREPGTIYRFSTSLVFACAFAGVALGIARGMVEALTALAVDKTPRGARSNLRDSPVFQATRARAEAQLQSARLFLLHAADEAWQTVARSGDVNLDQRIAIRLAATYAINQAADVVATAYHAAGATAVFENAPFERRFRDAHAVSQQVQGRLTHFETVGRHLLGLDPDTFMFL